MPYKYKTNLLLLKYNNYYNRIVKKENTISEYVTAADGTEVDIPSVSFNPNDGVNTEQIVNDIGGDILDYAVYYKNKYDSDTNALIESVIISRWFIMEAQRTRTGQYKLSLKRDVIVDNFDVIKEAPIFVEKGMLDDKDPMICNDEGMRFNQIKVNETRIVPHDFGDGADVPYEECPWLLAFLTKDSTDGTITVATNEFPTDTYTAAQIASDVGITESQLINYLKFPSGTEPIGKAYGNEIHVNFGYGGSSVGTIWGYGWKFVYNENGFSQWEDNKVYSNDYVFMDAGHQTPPVLENVFGNISSTTLQNITTKAFNEFMLNWQQIKKLESYIGKKVDVNGVIYKIGSIRKTESGAWLDEPLANDDAVIDPLTTAVVNSGAASRGSGVYHISTRTRNVYLELEETTAGNITLNLSVAGKTRNKTANCVCDIIAIPFSNIPFGKTNSNVYEFYGYAKLSREELYRIATAFSEKLGDNCKDVQIVPYININTRLGYYDRDEGTVDRPCIDLNGLDKGKDYLEITKDDHIVSYAFCLPTANVQTYRELYILQTNPKIQSQTEFIRFVSPTGQSIYEMNPSKNGGLNILNITGTLKPYNTYYKITPNFGFLYGQNFDKDQRGLIIQDNFSMTQISDAWTQYQLQNKNYQEIFNRQLQSLDVQQGIARQEAPIKAIAGTLSGAVSGAIAGGIAGGPYGAIAGGAAGGLASGIAGGMDLVNIDKQLKDQRDLQIQNFNYQLGNIVARPDTITRTDTFNIDSKLLPSVEYYSCTDAEKRALENKITYDGMTVMRIGTISEFKDRGGFFKGQLIRTTDFAGDTHELMTINTELAKGVYL